MKFDLVERARVYLEEQWLMKLDGGCRDRKILTRSTTFVETPMENEEVYYCGRRNSETRI